MYPIPTDYSPKIDITIVIQLISFRKNNQNIQYLSPVYKSSNIIPIKLIHWSINRTTMREKKNIHNILLVILKKQITVIVLHLQTIIELKEKLKGLFLIEPKILFPYQTDLILMGNMLNFQE